MIFNFIPANSAKLVEMMDMNIHKTTNELTLKRKTAKARVNAKKRDNTALPYLREIRECNMCFGPQKLSTKIPGCLSSNST